MKSADEWLEEYGESHQHPINKMIHWICIPLIMMSLIGMLWAIQITPWFNAGMLLCAVALVWYLLLSPRLAMGMAVVTVGMLGGLFVLSRIPLVPLWASCAVVFVIAWIFQFYGHKLEGKKPSFFKDLQFLLVGPMWLLGHTYRILGISY